MSKEGVLELNLNSDYFNKKSESKKAYNERLRLQFGREGIERERSTFVESSLNRFA